MKSGYLPMPAKTSYIRQPCLDNNLQAAWCMENKTNDFVVQFSDKLQEVSTPYNLNFFPLID